MSITKNTGKLSDPVFITEMPPITFNPGDIQIGAVELKDGATDVRATIVAANTAKSTATVALSTQPIDAAGNVLGRTAANVARTTATLVDPVQIVSAAGAVDTLTLVTTVSTVTAVTTITNTVKTKEEPDATSTYSLTPYISAALETSAVIKASAGTLYGAYMTNTNAAVRYFQVFNSATVPADAATPALTFPVQPAATFSFDTGKFSNYFSAGISVCISTTLATKTLGAAEALFYVQYK